MLWPLGRACGRPSARRQPASGAPSLPDALRTRRPVPGLAV